MTNVIPLHGGVAPNEPQPDVIEALQNLLVRAENGDVQGLALVIVRADGNVATAWHGSPSQLLTLAGVALLHHQVAELCMENLR